MPLATPDCLCCGSALGCIPAAITAMALNPHLISHQFFGLPYPSCCLQRGINHRVGAMHWEQGNKMSFHAIILCNKAPGGRKTINNVSCVSQLLPKIKHSPPPSAALVGAQVQAPQHDTRGASTIGAGVPAAPCSAPRACRHLQNATDRHTHAKTGT